ncbi:hypothetical protein GQ600_2767 [Phytophthora cactorum]|nr:hypothetical protein GQ600_2767 [Phytophthora cactorum]
MGVHAWVHSTTMVRIWFTSYTFRPAGAQPRFMFAPPERRWSLRMVEVVGLSGLKTSRLRPLCNSVKALEGKIDMLVSIIQPTTNGLKLNTRECDQSDECRTDINSPTSKGLEGYVPMYWNADAARHLFKHVSEWTSLERKKSGVLPSRLSVAKCQRLRYSKRSFESTKRRDLTLSTYAVYYTEHWLKDTAELNVLTIDTLARYIRLDRNAGS